MKDPRSIQRRTAMAACGLFAMGAAFAADDPAKFPERPVRIIVPYAAGGTSDLLARYIGQKLSERWGQQVVVDNRAGGGTVIGASAVARSAPDGYNLLLTNNTHVINTHLMTNLPYDAVRDFTPVATLATSAYLLLLNPSVPAQNLQEFIALLKSRPGKVNFGTHGPGGLTHLAAEMLNLTAGTKMQMVQYKGAGPALTAILAGEVEVYLDAPATTLPYVQSGKLRAIGISGSTRLPSLPNVPPISQAGVPGFDVTIWYGLLGPAQMPAAVTNKINADLAAVLSLAEVKEKLEALGVTPYASKQPDFARFVRSEQDKYGRIVKAADIKAN
ncbi:MAG TPA: tripartite tricarboxylate transporter substrate binding protein [Ramlibacter sp.]|jgi:tripartite-type tricarboxylate transporter receptor subunit TctC|nr:tripartite tricarboxylate transporter substrate binding protein [Ramlibacter sp.]